MPGNIYTKAPKAVYALLMCFFLPWILYSQQSSSRYNINYRLLTQEDGLASRNVNAGLQDSRGFVWLGTRDGLNRYDGYRFQLFTKEKNGLQENNIVHLSEDADQNLWILYGKEGVNTISRGKLDLLDINSHKVRPFDSCFAGKAPFKESEIVGIAADREHNTYIFCNNDFVYLYTGKNRFRKLNKEPLQNPINQFVFINHATDSGVWLRYDCFVRKDGNVTVAPRYDSGYFAMAFMEDDKLLLMHLGKDRSYSYSQAKIVNVTPEGTYKYDNELPETVKKQFYDICKFDFYMVLRDQVTGYSVVQSGGNSIYLFRDKKLISLFDSLDAGRIPSLSITSVFTDNEGKLWICTNMGAMIFKIAQNRFTHYLNSTAYKINGERPNYQVRGIYADTNGNIFISSTTGAYHIRHLRNDIRVRHLSMAPYSCPMVKDGVNYYFGHNALYEYNSVTKTERKLFIVKGLEFIWSIYKLSENRWLISDQTKFSLYKDGKFHPVVDSRTGDTLKNVWIHQFLKDRKGVLWAIGSKGLFQMGSDSTVSKHWGTEEARLEYKLPVDGIHCVHEDNEGNFWMATDGHGLYKWIRKEHSFLHFTIADGLSSNLLYAIMEDERGFLWISSDNGLMRFNKNDFTVKTYTAKDGLTNNEFNRLSYFEAADGRMFFGGLDGVNAFYPQEFWNDNQVFSAPLEIISYNQYKDSSGRLEDLTSELLTNRRITLHPGDNFFIIEFALLDFEIGKHRYAYKISGIDKDWNYLETNRLRLSLPQYGKYTLKIKAQNNEGQWSENELNIPIQVITPFYKQTSFIFVCITIAIALIFIYMRYKVWQFRRRNLALEKIIYNRTNELRTSLEQKEILLKEIHHRVKNNLQVISGLLQLQSRKTDNKVAKEALLDGHNRVLSIALIHQKLYQNEKPDTVAFAGFANELFYHINGIFSREASVHFNNRLPDVFLDIDIAVPLGLILNELMNNSLKYAFTDIQNPEITLELTEEGNRQVFIYADNGTGLPADFDFEHSKSLGMHLIRRLTRQLNGQVMYYNDGGAVFKFSLPKRMIYLAVS